MTFLFVLPAWVAAFFVFRQTLLEDWREAAVAAAVVWGVIVLVLTEVLSLFHALAFIPLLVAWGLISGASFGVLIRVFTKGLVRERGASYFLRKHPVAATIVAGVFCIFLATFVVAFVSPPNNWDSMTYHMARVVNWIDHRSIRHYPTHILRQLYLGPWAEFAITHLQILTGGDRFANFVQFVAWLGSAVAASLVSKKLGAGQIGQLFAFLFSATIPIGILEASTTQNDYVTAFWLLCFINFSMDLAQEASISLWTTSILAGASLGLAILTKPTAIIFGAPFFVWASIAVVRRLRAASPLLIAVLCAATLAINAGHFARNQSAFGSPFGPGAETALYKNQIHTPAALCSNVIRNVAVHLAIPKIGPYLKALVFKIHSLTGLDISDPLITMGGETFEYYVNLNENFAGNPLHLLIATCAIGWAIWHLRRSHIPAIYAACLLTETLMFCGYLRWQLWISRLHLPLFVAVAPVCGLVFSRPGFRRIGYVWSAIAVLVGLLYATKNDTRPLIEASSVLTQRRTDMYFNSRRELRAPFFAAAKEVARRNPLIVGIISGQDDWEYPFRLLVRKQLGTGVQFEHFNVRNESRNCAPEIMTVDDPPDKIVIIGFFVPETLPPGYKAAFVSEPIRVFERYR
jgi:hypothetical protein